MTRPLPPPRSDGAVLHVDAENYVDTLTGLNNAGVRWLGEPWVKGNHGVTEVTRGFAFSGERALHAATAARRQRAMIRVLARADAPAPGETTVLEFVFRPVRSQPVDLRGWIVFQPCDSDMDRRTGITLSANGTADSGRYDIDVLEGGGRRPRRRSRVLTGLSQRRWTRFILMRRRGTPTVQLWAGAPAGNGSSAPSPIRTRKPPSSPPAWGTTRHRRSSAAATGTTSASEAFWGASPT